MSSPSATPYFTVEAPINCLGSVASDFGSAGLKSDVISPSTGTTGSWSQALTDNLADAFSIKEGSNSYLKFVTTNSAEKVVIGKSVQFDGGLAAGTMFKSTEQTGTGAPQNVAHGLATTPSMVWWALSNLDVGLAAGPPPTCTVVPGTHTSTNAVFTVTSGVKFYVFALK